MNRLWWKIRFAWHMCNQIGKYWPDDIGLAWDSAEACFGSQPESPDDWDEPLEAAQDEIACWYD